MISRKLWFKIISYVIAIVLCSALMSYLVISQKPVKLWILCILVLVLLTASLINFLNRTNRQIKFFFDSVRNEDSGLSFPAAGHDKTLDELYSSMNNVNKMIQQLKLRNSQQEQYFRTILEHLATGIVTYDKKGFIHHINTPARKLLSLETLTHLRQLEKVDKKLFSSISSLKPFQRRLVGISTAEGEKQLALKATTFGSDEHEMIILSVQDIKNELDEKETDSWMKLIRVLMHEIMNSITPITSLSESLSKIYKTDGRTVTPPEVTEKTINMTLQGLEVIRDQGKGLSSFVESYRKLTHIPRPEKKLLKVHDVFSRVKILAGSLEKKGNSSILFEEDGADIEILADENLVSLVLINLIKNAVEANEENSGALIRIKAGLDSENHPVVCVTDNGPGIDQGDLDKIFVPFFTTKKSGSGIGLSISRQIMGVHGGTLKVRSVPGKETVFCMSFRS